MAAAAKHTIVQVSDIVPAGALNPECIVTPGIYVNSIVKVASSYVGTSSTAGKAVSSWPASKHP